MDIAPQLFIAHLRGLLDFLLEIRRRLADPGKGRHIEGAETLYSGAAQVADPPLRANPALQRVLPVGPLGMYTLCQSKGGRIELKHGQAAKLIALRIEQLVVVDIGMLPEDPLAVGVQISLRRFTFDQVA